MRRFLRRFFPGSAAPESSIHFVNLRAELALSSDEELKAAGRRAAGFVEVLAVTAVVAARVLGVEMFDVQLQGAMALAQGKIAEMRTG